MQGCQFSNQEKGVNHNCCITLKSVLSELPPQARSCENQGAGLSFQCDFSPFNAKKGKQSDVKEVSSHWVMRKARALWQFLDLFGASIRRPAFESHFCHSQQGNCSSLKMPHV